MQCLFISALLLVAAVAAAPASNEELLSELKHLRATAGTKDGVIRFNDDMITRYGSGKTRTYSLVIFLTANQVMDNPQLQMQKLRTEYGLASKAYQAGPTPNDAFFVDMVFEESPRVFRSVNANQVPFIFSVPAGKKVSLKSMEIDRADRMQFDTVQAKYPWSAEDIVDFMSKGPGLQFGEIDRPSFYKSPLFPITVIATIITLCVGFYVAYAIGLVHHPVPYAIGAVGVFWFSVGGGMYNIIRGMPFYIYDKNGRIQFFLGSRGGQLGAEGLIIGSGYVAFSACIALLTYAVPRARSKAARTVLGYGLVFGAAYLASKLFMIYTGKTGYRISTYLLR